MSDECTCKVCSPDRPPEEAHVYDHGGWRVPTPGCPVHNPEEIMSDEPKVIRAYCSVHEWEHEPMLEERYFYSEDRRHLLALHDLQIYDLPYGSGEVEVAILPRDGDNVGPLTPEMVECLRKPVTERLYEEEKEVADAIQQVLEGGQKDE